MNKSSIIRYGKSGDISDQESSYLQRWKLSKGITRKKALYNVLNTTSVLYLPTYKSRCVTHEYLDGVLLTHYFSIPKALVRYCNLEDVNITSDLVYYELCCYLKKKVPIFSLGFDEYNLPDKKWLLDVMYTLNPESQIFNTQFEETPETMNITLLVDGPIVADAEFKNAKHPLFCKYLYDKSMKRKTKRNLYTKHCKKIIEKSHKLIEQRIGFLEARYKEDVDDEDNIIINLPKEPWRNLALVKEPENTQSTDVMIESNDDLVFNEEQVFFMKSFTSKSSKDMKCE